MAALSGVSFVLWGEDPCFPGGKPICVVWGEDGFFRISKFCTPFWELRPSFLESFEGTQKGTDIRSKRNRECVPQNTPTEVDMWSGLWFHYHFPRFHFGHPFLTHSHLNLKDSTETGIIAVLHARAPGRPRSRRPPPVPRHPRRMQCLANPKSTSHRCG